MLNRHQVESQTFTRVTIKQVYENNAVNCIFSTQLRIVLYTYIGNIFANKYNGYTSNAY